MKTRVILTSIASFLVVLVACTETLALQLQNGANQLQREEYEPIVTDFLVRYLDDRSTAEGRNLDSIGGGHLLRQTRRGYDFYPALTYGESKPYFPLRRPAVLNARVGDYDEIHPMILDRFSKRNIDEIDGNAFDSFYKRNFDEIDRVGWSGFVKRLSNYLTKQQQQQQQQQR